MILYPCKNSGGGTVIEGNAAPADVLSGKTFMSNNSPSKQTGTMTNRGAVTASITENGGSYTIPAGYHNGNGRVTANVPSKINGANGDLIYSFAIGTTGSDLMNILKLQDGTVATQSYNQSFDGNVIKGDYATSPYGFTIKAKQAGHYNGFICLRNNSTGDSTITSIDGDYAADATIGFVNTNFVVCLSRN